MVQKLRSRGETATTTTTTDFIAGNDHDSNNANANSNSTKSSANTETWEAWDDRMTNKLYRTATKNPVCMRIARTVNLLVDDGPFIGGISFAWLSALACRRFGVIDSTSCLPDAINEIFLRFMMWTVTESIMKLVLQKPRPSHYGHNRHSSHVGITLEELQKGTVGNPPKVDHPNKQKGVMIPGDHYSFPSGHTQRAFGCARILVVDALVNAEIGSAMGISQENTGIGAMILLMLAFTIGWARIALGKHSLLDVIGGGLLGVFTCDVLEQVFDSEYRWAYQKFCLLYFSLIALICMVDLTRKCDSTDVLGLRKSLGFMDTAQQINFVCLPFAGCWIMALGSATCTPRN